MLPKGALEEFKRLYKQEFGEELSDKNTLEKATRFLGLMRLIRKLPPW